MKLRIDGIPKLKSRTKRMVIIQDTEEGYKATEFFGEEIPGVCKIIYPEGRGGVYYIPVFEPNVIEVRHILIKSDELQSWQRNAIEKKFLEIVEPDNAQALVDMLRQSHYNMQLII